MYGEGATSGIINIITNKQKENIGVLSVGTGSYGTQTTNAFLSKTTERMKLSIFGKTTNSNGFRDQSESRLKSGGIQLDHQINESASTGLRYAEDRNYANLPGYLSLTKYTQNPNQAQSSLSSLYDNRAVNSTITSKLTSGYLKYRDGDFSYLIDIARKDSKIDYMNTSWYEDDLYTSTQDAINGKVKIDNFLSPNNTLVAGLSSSRSHRNARVFDLPVTSPNSTGYTSQNGKAIFAQNDWKFTDVDRFTFGVRREYFKQSTNGTGTYWDSNFNPHPYNKVQSGKNNLNAYELQYSKDISNAITNYVKIGQSYRLPNVDDLSRPCNSISCIDNLALKPQTNKDFEIGSIYNSGPNRGYFKYYQSIITDEILFDKSSNNWVGLNLNIPKTRRKGLEYYNSHSYDSHLAINTSISLIESIFLVDSFGSTSGIYGKNISGTPNYILGIGFDYSINAKNTVSWNSRLIGNQYPQGDNNNFYKLDSYSLSDFSYRWSDKKWSVVANINNVFDKKYGTAILASQSNPNSVNYPYVMYPNWGRNFLITLRYAFE